MIKKLDCCIFFFYKWLQHISLWLNITSWFSIQSRYLQPEAITAHCGIMAQYISEVTLARVIYWCGLQSQWTMFSSSVNNFLLTSMMIWLLSTMKYGYHCPKNILYLIYKVLWYLFKTWVTCLTHMARDYVIFTLRTTMWAHLAKQVATFTN